MSKFGISQPVRRVEDLRFLTGAGKYLDDLNLSGQARAIMVRAPVAHADFTVDASDARAMPGVLMILTSVELDAALDNDMDALTLDNLDGT
ncbi:MAG: xanthine dehydrogenase family protein molybdopterin-binding subunit, partial [Pseudomonadota bacterium]